MSEFNVFDPVKHPDRTGIYDRTAQKSGIDRVYFAEDKFVHGADLNESATREALKRKSIGDLVASEGDKISGAEVIVDTDNATVTITEGQIYSNGSVIDVPAAVLLSVPMVGSVTVGYAVAEEIIDHEDDPDYLGLHPGVPGFEEPGAVRTSRSVSWLLNTSVTTEKFYPFVEIKDGEIVAQDEPATLSGVSQQIARYVTHSAGNFISEGFNVRALGLTGAAQTFSVQAGVAYVKGFAVNRNTDNRFLEPEEPELITVASEPQTYVDDGGSSVVTLNNSPIKAVELVTVTKQQAVTISRGPVDEDDDLTANGVTQILSVQQGATTYVEGVDYDLIGDKVHWLESGSAPAFGSTYDVSFHYLDEVTPSAISNDTITVSGGVDGEQMFIRYLYALPRKDCMCVDAEGNLSYLKGISTSRSPFPPAVPAELLKIAEIHNDFAGTPTVVNNGTRNAPFDEIRRMFDLVINTNEQTLRNRGANGIAVRSQGRPDGSFSDPLINDAGRDAGATQTAAVFGGSIQLAVTPTFVDIDLGAVQMLDFTESINISQDFETACERINPYQVFTPLPAILTINPSQDFWTETQQSPISEVTRVFGFGDGQRTVSNEIFESSSSERIENLRQIQVNFTVNDFGAGENLDSLTFDGIDLTPDPVLVADANGTVSGSFVIPANVVAGSKQVRVVGGSGTVANATFTGEGTLEIISLQRITTIQRFRVEQPNRNFGESDDSNETGGPVDPQAQSFVLNRGAHISSIDLKICAIGDRNNPVLVEIVTVDNGFPTTEVIAQTEISMQTVVVGQTTKFEFDVPVYLPSGIMFAFVVKTNDADHSIAIANRGGFDAAKQEHVAAQPYNIGTRFSSSNAMTWTPHQDSDVTFGIYSPVFSPLEKTVFIGTYAVTDVSDIIVACRAFLPNGDTSAVFELKFGDEDPIRVLPNQNYERDSFFSGNLSVSLIMSGSASASPIVNRNISLVLGTLQTTGVYTGIGFPVGVTKTVRAACSTLLPSGSSFTIEVDAQDDNWQTLPQTSATAIDGGFVEREFEQTNLSLNPDGRVRVTVTGTPAARPAIADLIAFSF